jgi:hypothetical protein
MTTCFWKTEEEYFRWEGLTEFLNKRSDLPGMSRTADRSITSSARAGIDWGKVSLGGLERLQATVGR